jgi:DNA mismatch repair protein MutS2
MDDHTLEKLEWSSVLGLVEEFVVSKPARKLLRALRPSRDQAEVENLVEESRCMAFCLAEGGKPPFRSLEPIEPILGRARCQGAVLEPGEVLSIKDLLEAARALRAWFGSLSGRAEALANRVDRLDTCPELKARIDETLDETGRVRDEASSRLEELRRGQSSLRRRVLERLEEIIHQKKEALQEPLVTLRDGRYVLPVRREAQHSVSGIVHGVSDSGATLFIEPLETVEDVNRLRTLAEEEEAEIRRILQELTAEVAKHAVALAITAQEIASLEVITAKARFGEAYGGVFAESSANGLSELKEARHPLLEARGFVVPLDVVFGGDEAQTLVITGPNTGGKTVALKTIGLCVCMRQAGLPVLAREGTRVDFFETVVADIGDEQSLEQNLSTFSSHMVHIVEALRQAGPSTLVLLDELGAGTEPAEGSALGIAVLEALRQRGATVVATTHHEPIKVYAYGSAGAKNAAMEFDEETLQPTYRLIMGPAGESRAIQVAERLGLEPSVVERARALRQPAGVAKMLQSLEAETRRIKALEEALQAQRKELEEAEGRLKAAREALESEKTSLRQRLDENLRDLKRQVESFVAEVRRGKREAFYPKELFEPLETLREVLKPEGLEEVQEPLREGQWVEITSLGREGLITSLGEQGVEVAVGQMTVRLSPEEVAQGVLKPKPGPPPAWKSSAVTVKAGEPGEEVGFEIKLIGQRVEEALPRLDKWLDEAVLRGLERVRIVHGKGTGALRRAVVELLEDHPHVKSHSLAPPEEGGAGVTVVELKG